MRRILRRSVTRDPFGRPLASQSERLTDDGRGWLQVTTERAAAFCSGCRRPIVDLAERRGVCDVCRSRECCVHCVAQCQVCFRRLCGQCRRGFAGRAAFSVCISCQNRLLHRQAFEDEQSILEAEYRRHFEQQHLLNQVEALRLNAERTHIMAQLQAMRMGLLPQLRPGLLWRLLGFTVGKVRDYARRALR